jgi:hypothetical protein
MDRRRFLITTALCTAAVGLGAPLAAEEEVEVRYVSAFSAPFVKGSLRERRPLGVEWRHGKACLTLGPHLLGWLPSPAAARTRGGLAQVLVSRAETTLEGRLRLFVLIRD